MDDEMMAGQHNDGLILDDEAAELVHHQWLQFEPGTGATVRCRRLLRIVVGAQRNIDWSVLADAVITDQEEEQLPDIEFQLYGQHFEMKIERFTVLIGIYYEPETVTVTDAFV
ncbi:hypothetical protein R6Q57_005656 [Mikania cordata]